MLNKRYMTMVMLGISALLMISAVWAKELRPTDSGVMQDRVLAATPGNPPRLIPSLAVTRQAGEVTYSVWLRNPSDTEVRDIFLAVSVAPGTTFIAPGPNPARSGFRGVEGGNVTFLSEAVPAGSDLGPFSYRMRLSGDTADAVRAWAHWRQPADSSNLSAPVRVLPSVTVGVLASGSVEPERILGEGPYYWTVAEVVRPAQTNEPGRTQPNPRLVYMLEGTARTFSQNGVTGTFGPGSAHFIAAPGVPFDDAVHHDAPVRHLVFFLGRSARATSPPSATVSVLFQSEDLTGVAPGPHRMTLSLVEAHPGGSTPTHFHPGPTVVYVLEGTVIHNLETGSKVYGPGSFFVEQAGELNSQVYPGPGVAKLLSARIVPEGQPASTFTTEARPHPWTAR